jgi:putative ABC transport system permease protein
MMNYKPPRSFLNFLRWFCRDDFIEEIEGNLIELYEKQSKVSPFKARWNFYWNVLLHFRPAFIKSFGIEFTFNSNLYDMFRNYLLIGWRNLLKNKIFSTINLTGFSLGFIAAIFIALYVIDELSFDRYPTHSDRIYRIIETVRSEDGTRKVAATASQIGPAAMGNLPEVENFVRVTILGRLTLGHREFRDYEPVVVADSTFFQIFDCRFIEGDPESALRKSGFGKPSVPAGVN